MGVAVLRAVETRLPANERLFEDPYASDFVPALLMWFLGHRRVVNAIMNWRERQIPGIRMMLLCRTRCLDDLMTDAIAAGVDQVVILGAGFDSRGFRIDGVEQTRIYEVDHPPTQALKTERLRRRGRAIPSNLRFVPVNFDTDDLESKLAEAGFRFNLKTFFIWEGVTQYITAEAVNNTLHFVSRCAVGSTIAFTYVRQDVVDGTGVSEAFKKLLRQAESFGEPWIFGIDPAAIETFLRERGLELVEEVDSPEHRRRYLEPLGRIGAVSDIEPIAVARVPNS
jgi:methyltransferase (TIGR00027 family)